MIILTASRPTNTKAIFRAKAASLTEANAKIESLRDWAAKHSENLIVTAQDVESGTVKSISVNFDF